MLTGGAVGVVMFGPHLAGAQTTTTAPQTDTSVHSNEDPTHEAGESADHEAAENNGTFRGRGAGSNEDAAHEAAETPEHEAAENARQMPTPATPANPAPATMGSSVGNL